MHLARAVRCHQHDRRMRGLHGAELRHGDLEIGQHFQQERLEGLVGAVDLVDQQHRRPVRVGLQRLQQRPLDQEALGEHVVLDALAVALAFRFRQPNGDHLRAVIPLIDGGRKCRAPRSIAGGSAGAPASLASTLAISVLPTPASPSTNSGRPILQRQIKHRRQRAVGDVIGLGQQIEGGLDGGRERLYGHIRVLRGDFIRPRGRLTCGYRRPSPASQELHKDCTMTKPVRNRRKKPCACPPSTPACASAMCI